MRCCTFHMLILEQWNRKWWTLLISSKFIQGLQHIKTTVFCVLLLGFKWKYGNFTHSHVLRPFCRVFARGDAAAVNNKAFICVWNPCTCPARGTFSHRLVNTAHHHKRFHQDFVGTDQITGGEWKFDLTGDAARRKKRERFSAEVETFANSVFFLLVRHHGRQTVRNITALVSRKRHKPRTDNTLLKNNLLPRIPQPSRLLRCKTTYYTSLNHVCALY